MKGKPGEGRERDKRNCPARQSQKCFCAQVLTASFSLIEEKYFFSPFVSEGEFIKRSMKIKWLLNENKRKIIREAELSPAHIRIRKKHDICVSFASYLRFL